MSAIQTIGSTIDEMNAIAAGVAAAMEEQGAATGEIARNVQQAAQGTQVVTSSILDVKRGARETGSAAAQVLTAAQELARHSEDLGREFDSFLSGVKVARCSAQHSERVPQRSFAFWNVIMFGESGGGQAGPVKRPPCYLRAFLAVQGGALSEAEWELGPLLEHAGRLSTSEAARIAASEPKLSRVSVSKAAIPLTADAVEKVGLEDVVKS